MKFLPWNRLQQDSSAKTGQRVFKQSVSFDLYRTYKKKVSWNPIAFKNGALFYGEEKTQLTDFLETMEKQANNFKESCTIALYDLTGTHQSESERIESNSRVFEYHPYDAPLDTLLEDLLQLRQEIKENSLSMKYTESPYRKALIVLIHITEEQAQRLSYVRTASLMKDLLLESAFERIYPFLIVESAESINDNILKALEWSAFIGGTNVMRCKNDLYPNMKDSYYSIRQVVIGVVYSRTFKYILNVHPYKFTPSEYHVKKEQQLIDEDAAYMRYLNTLSDGTIEGVK